MGADRGDVKSSPVENSSVRGSRMPRVVANGRHLFYEEEGQGEPLVFLSGLGGDHRAFSVTMRQFWGRGGAGALDARDGGQSGRAEAPYTTADLADDVAAWLEALGL